MNKRILKSFIGGFALIGFLAGCAAVETLDTPTGKPEVTIAGVTKREALSALTGIMEDANYITREVTDDRAFYYKRTFMVYAAPPMGPKHAANPEVRVYYDTAETEAGVRVITTVHLLVNPEGPYPEIKDISRGRDARDIQRLLERLRAKLEK